MTLQQATTLRATLQSMFDNIEKRQDIIADLQQLEQLQQEIASTAPPMLNHYLQRRSYEKALEFLTESVVAEDSDRTEGDN
jgi:hypothetical protein